MIIPNENTVEQAALSWLGEVRWQPALGPRKAFPNALPILRNPVIARLVSWDWGWVKNNGIRESIV